MTTEGFRSARGLAFRIVLGQLGITLLVALVFLPLSGFHASLSALMGGGIGSLAGLLMAVSMFRHSDDTDAKTILGDVYKGELLKLVLTVVLFAVVIAFYEVSWGALFCGYIATFFVYWVALLRAIPSKG